MYKLGGDHFDEWCLGTPYLGLSGHIGCFGEDELYSNIGDISSDSNCQYGYNTKLRNKIINNNLSIFGSIIYKLNNNNIMITLIILIIIMTAIIIKKFVNVNNNKYDKIKNIKNNNNTDSDIPLNEATYGTFH